MSKKSKFSSWRDDLAHLSEYYGGGGYGGAYGVYGNTADLKKQTARTQKQSEKEITEKPVKNKVLINPPMREAFEEFGGVILEVVELTEKEVDVPDTRRTVDAIRAYDRSKDASRDATYDTMHGKKKKGDKEKAYAKKERGEIKKDDPNWKNRKYHTGMHGEGYAPGDVDQKVGAVTGIPKQDQMDARARLLAKTKAKRDKRKSQVYAEFGEGLTGARADRARQMQDSDIKRHGGRRTDRDRDTAFRLGTGTGPGRVGDRPIKSQNVQGRGSAAKRRMGESASNPFQVHFDKDGKSYTDKGTKRAAERIRQNAAANRKKGPMKYDPENDTRGT